MQPKVEEMNMEFWDEWRGDFDGRVVMQIKHLASWRGFKLDLHRFVAADAPGCRHTHPAKAWRLVIWGGYVEEVEVGTTLELRTCSPLFAGMVQPQLCHRIDSLLGKVSYSLWLRWPKSHEVELRGDGWGDRAGHA